ncbi:hypothetical protein [Levilactobacillus brevis]|uniref:Anti-bacteriophage protein A/HamA C-terminal domain-containing protein n=1 Tax=Levilactobacillus brevis TaxID=1580 RepID=A0AA41EML0_LEVBR|nr:hypothetical protein [Levilactobacillus brevis]KID44783.1 hypothetical protein LbDm2_0140 [Levilactobacillus brevis]MBS0946378.1 hypothetical protein [Levilactobacillus brevis]MBS0978970.1 hypothetical protein [Levilactobacillus brevis]MBS1009527.1 hypothetical protein [Levilactobacillus brevis]MCU0199770.1 hypothetical protein [Levilactobacillus brevis]
MKNIPVYMDCFYETTHMRSIDNHDIELVKIKVPFDNDDVVKEWASSFRKKFISNVDLNDMIVATQAASPYKFLTDYIYPDKVSGNIVRIGDFGEILVADYLMFIRNYWIPSLLTRYSQKQNKDKSTMGTDIFAIKLADKSISNNPKDELCICEVKTGFSDKAKKRLTDAVLDVNKDNVEIADRRASVSLAATMLTLKRRSDISPSYIDQIRRFQNPLDNPFKESYLAAAVIDETQIRRKSLEAVPTVDSPHKENLKLITFHGEDLKKLMDALYGEFGVSDLE